jgi:hypothetical protein
MINTGKNEVQEGKDTGVFLPHSIPSLPILELCPCLSMIAAAYG